MQLSIIFTLARVGTRQRGTAGSSCALEHASPPDYRVNELAIELRLCVGLARALGLIYFAFSLCTRAKSLFLRFRTYKCTEKNIVYTMNGKLKFLKYQSCIFYSNLFIAQFQIYYYKTNLNFFVKIFCTVNDEFFKRVIIYNLLFLWQGMSCDCSWR